MTGPFSGIAGVVARGMRGAREIELKDEERRRRELQDEGEQERREVAQHNHNLLNTTRSEMARLTRELGDHPDERSPHVREIRTKPRALRTRADSLSQVTDSASTEFSQPVAFGAARPGVSTVVGSEMEDELREARNAYDAALQQGADSAQARRLYEQVVQAIRAKRRR